MALTLDGTNGISASGGVNVLQDDSVVTGNLVDGAVTVPKIGATGSPDNSNFLRGDGAWEAVPPGSTPGQLELLQEDTFTTSGTWTKPTGFDANDTIVVVCISGGGSGAASGLAASSAVTCGGGMAGVGVIGIRYADAPASLSVTVGAGGPGVTAVIGNTLSGNGGGDSIFGPDLANSFVFARSRGGFPSFGVTRPFVYQRVGKTTTTLEFSVEAQIVQAYPYGPAGRSINTAGTSFVDYPGLTGGGGGIANSGTTYRTQVQQGHKGTVFGEGGDAGAGANGSNGTAPGGGGGGARSFATSTTSGAGADGAIIVYVYRGRVHPNTIFPITV
jgi:hypothetical protein